MTKISKISLILTIVLTLFLTFFCRGLFRSQFISVAINMTSSASVTHKLHWSVNGKDFKAGDVKSFHTHLNGAPELIEIKIPASEVRKIQLNLNSGALGASYTISSFKINGTDYRKDLKFYNLDKKENLFTAKGSNPALYVNIPEKLPAKALPHYDPLPMAAFALTLGILIYSLLSGLLIPLYLTSPQKGQVPFLCLITIILTLPLLRTHVFETKSVEENRNLASPPPIFRNNEWAIWQAV